MRMSDMEEYTIYRTFGKTLSDFFCRFYRTIPEFRPKNARKLDELE
jgi:hypothetical protein